ncbi:hypothetical protein WJX75_005727 [Coccomyxa subellipsoidea]|uniref:Uncharacterized protein n=1 Tax=Coccomyxa subellipsoidea TaxID=248742 RepID=A0ABR2Z1J3_9CHLO
MGDLASLDSFKVTTILNTDDKSKNTVSERYLCQGTVDPASGQINIDIIHPATEKHISKLTAQQYFSVTETPSSYQTVTLPYIESIPSSRIQWVYNILDKKVSTVSSFINAEG